MLILFYKDVKLIYYYVMMQEEDILKKQKALFKEASNYIKPYRKDLKQYEDFYNNKQWPFGQDRPTRNEIFKIIESEVPILTDSMPGTDVIAQQEGRELDAKLLETAIHNVYDANNIHLIQSQAVRAALISWPTWLYPDYDPDASNGDGEIKIKALPWRQVYIDPTATTIDEANYAIIQIPLKVEEIKRRFPEKAKNIKAQKISLSEYGDILDKTQTESFDSNFFGNDNDKEDRYALQDMAILEEAWLRDYSKVPISEDETLNELDLENEQLLNGINPQASKYEDHMSHQQAHKLQLVDIAAQALMMPHDQITEDDIEQLKSANEEMNLLVVVHQDHIRVHELLLEENPNAEKPKYKNNWRVIINVGDQIFKDQESDLNIDMIPLVPIYAYKDDTYHGFGAVKNIIELQKTLNENRFSILQSLRLMSNNIWVRDEDCGVPSGKITNEPGAVYTKKRGTELRREMAPPVSADLFRQVELDADVMEQLEGINETVQGVSPGANASGRQVRLLRDQAVGRIRLKTRYLIDSMKRLGIIVASLVVNNYTAEKMLRVRSDSGQITFQQYDPERLNDLKYFVNIVPGTTAGIDKEIIEADAKELLAGGFIDFRDYLKVSTLPFKDSLLQSLDEKENIQGTIDELQRQNLVLRAKLDPNSLSKDEVKILEEIQREEINNELIATQQGEAVNG